MMRTALSIIAGIALAIGGTVAVAGSGYTPPSSGESLWQSTGGNTQLVAPQAVLLNTSAVNTTAVLTLQNAAGDASIFRVDANPEGVVTGSVGDIADDTAKGVVYVKTSGSATNTGWSPLANLGTKVYMVVEGGQYSTIQAAIDATPTGTNAVPAYSVILVGPKANTGAGASGTWGPAVLAANKSLMIVGIGGGQTNKNIRIDSLTFDSSAAGLNANLNENHVSGLYITSSSASSIVTLSGTGAIRLRLNNSYVVNSGAGDAVTNSNTSANASLYLDTCIVSSESVTGIALKHSGTYTAVRNRSDISTSAGGTSASAGRSLSASAGVVEIYDSTVGGAIVPRPAVELTGTAYVSAGYTTISNASNDAAARCVFVNSGTAVFAAGDATLALGSSVAAAGQVVSGTGTFAYGSITFSYSPLLTVSTQTPALRTGGWFTTAVQEGISLTSPGSPLFNLNSSGRITRYNDAAPTNGQVLIGDTAAGYFKAATLTAGSNVSITNAAGSVTISSTGPGVPAGGTVGQYPRKSGAADYALEWATASQTRTDLGLGTAATANTGTSSGNVPVLGMGGSLPAVDGSNLTGITSSQVSGLGTASASSTGDFVAASGFYSPDVWTYTWTPADGDPIATGGWTAVQSAATASTTVDGVACYSITPSGASGESSIYKNVGAASSSSWEARILLWSPNGNTSRFGWTYDSGIGTTDALYKVTMGGTTTPLRMNEATVTVPALQYTTRWVMWTLRCYYNLSTTQTCELYSGRIKLYTFEAATAEAAVSAGRFTIGRTTGAIVTAGCIGGIWVRSTGVNEAPVEFRERARAF